MEKEQNEEQRAAGSSEQFPNSDEKYPDVPPPDYETIMAIPDMNDLPPPPEYIDPGLEGIPGTAEESLDPHFTSMDGTSSNHGLPSLAYVDFLPQCRHKGSDLRAPTFDSFKTLMSIVNDWLKRNPHYRVIRCESIERKVKKDGILETETTIYHTPAYGDSCYVCGIRLWLAPNTKSEAPQEIWYMNVVPKSKPFAMPVAMCGMYGMPVYNMKMRPAMFAFPNFENLDAVLVKLNTRLREDPLPGEILTIESLEVKYGEMFDMNKCDPDRGYWRIKANSSTLYLTILRLFFVIGKPQVQQIGIEDFVSDCISSSSSLGTPQFEPFGKAVEEASQWIQSRKDMRVTSVQTVNLKLDHNIFKGRYQINTKKMDFSSGYFKAVFLKVLRVAYVQQAGCPAVHLTSRAFLPVRFGSRQSETTSQTVQRVNAWLNCTGAKVIGADTLHFEFNPELKRTTNTEKVSFTLAGARGYYWMTAIRLYFDGEYEEPPPHVLPPPPSYADQSSGSACCSIS